MDPILPSAYFAAVFESADDAFIGKDITGIIRTCNPAAERLFGYPADELIGKPVLMLIPPRLQGEEADILARIKRGERIDHFETVRLTKTGHEINVSLTISPIRNASGEIIGASKIARDMTDRRKAFEAQGYLAAIVESSDDAIISKDLSGIIQSANAAAERMFGYEPGELVGKPVLVLIPQHLQHEESEIVRSLRNGQRIEHFETVRITKSGQLLDISLTISPVFGPSGDIIGASKVARDITEQKRLARTIAAQQELFRVTLLSIGDAVIASDAQGRVTFMNPMAEKLTGWSTQEAITRPLRDVFDPVHDKAGQRADGPAAEIKESSQRPHLVRQSILVSRDGTEWPIEEIAAPILDDANQVLGTVLVFHEVSERRRLEAERRAAIAERERLLESERAARTEAERSNRVKDEFVAMVSHELRTPLNAILGWTEVLAKSPPDAATLERGLEVVARNTRLQAQLISDLLDISRIVSGKLQLHVERIDLGVIIEESIETVQHSANAGGVTLHRVLHPGSGVTVGDPARLQQVLWNVLSNAIKFTPAGGRITVELSHVNDNARITITDTGVGIPSHLLPGIFDRFRQIGSVSTRRHGGLGLGLSIARHLMGLHSGSIEAFSAGEGTGTTFTIELPLKDPQENMGQRAGAPAAAAAPSEGISLQNIKVLVVEDDPDTSELIRRILESHHAQVTTAASAPAALELLSVTNPDILLSDLGLPAMSGNELMERIRLRKDAFGSLPAIALTAFARPEDRARALRAGFHTHLTKPIEPAELVGTIFSFASLIESRRLGSPVTASPIELDPTE